MLKFLFGGKTTTPEVVIESDRARFTRLVGELNDAIDTLANKPRVTVDPANGHILPETPEQFADEALALPAPAPAAEEVAKKDVVAEVEAAEPDTTQPAAPADKAS